MCYYHVERVDAMNRKITIASCIILLIIGILVFVNKDEQTNKKDIDKDKYIQLANTYLNNLGINDKTFDSEAEVTKENKSAILTEITVSNSDMMVVINGKNDELYSYFNKKVDYQKNTLSEDEVEDMAFEILTSIANPDEYKLVEFWQFDEDVYQAKFFKKYGDFVNPGERIGLSFVPENSEIVTLTKTSQSFADNEIVISEEEAKEIAIRHLENNAEVDISIEIVLPNYVLKNVFKESLIYRELSKTRLAYVCKFDDLNKTQIYIDATTGSIIGEDMVIK